MTTHQVQSNYRCHDACSVLEYKIWVATDYQETYSWELFGLLIILTIKMHLSVFSSNDVGPLSTFFFYHCSLSFVTWPKTSALPADAIGPLPPAMSGTCLWVVGYSQHAAWPLVTGFLITKSPNVCQIWRLLFRDKWKVEAKAFNWDLPLSPYSLFIVYFTGKRDGEIKQTLQLMLSIGLLLKCLQQLDLNLKESQKLESTRISHMGSRKPVS